MDWVAYKQLKFIFHNFGCWKVQDQEAKGSKDWGEAMSLQMVTFSSVTTRWQGRGVSLRSLLERHCHDLDLVFPSRVCMLEAS